MRKFAKIAAACALLIGAVFAAPAAANAAGCVPSSNVRVSGVAAPGATEVVRLEGGSCRVTLAALAQQTAAPTTGAAASNRTGALAFTDSTVSMLVVWGAAGIIALSIAFIVVLALARRQRRNILGLTSPSPVLPLTPESSGSTVAGLFP